MARPDEVLIVGGGIMGSFTAYQLRRLGFGGRVRVLERDLEHLQASTYLATGGVRQQFGTEVNIRLARYSIDFYERFAAEMAVPGQPAPDIRLLQRGYLFLGDRTAWPALLERVALQRRLGVEVDVLSPLEAARLLPGLRTDDLEGAVFGRRDGYLVPKLVLRALVAKVRALDVEYVEDEVVGVLTEPDAGHPAGRRAVGVRGARSGPLHASAVVIAAGAWTGRICELAGLTPLVFPVRRQVMICRPARTIDLPVPMTIDPTGLHWREDDGRILLIQSFPDDPAAFDFTFDPSRFRGMARVAAARWPLLAGLMLEGGRAGLYEVNPFDHNGLIGPHPDLGGLYLIAGFSGHGVMQAPAAGLALAEILLTGRATAVPVDELTPARIATNRPVREEAVI
jgi:FAD-dependent oxidoreductase domain-containing protein 1